MSWFIKSVATSFKQQLTYRMALWAGLATNLFFGLLRAMLLTALYGTTFSVNGLSLTGSITYIAISQSLIAFLTVFGSTDLMNTVYSGAIGSDLLRPVGLFTFWMAKDLGKALVNLIGRGIIFMLLFSLFYPVVLPADLAQWLLFALSLALAWMVSFAWRFLVNLAGFWSPDARGIARIAFSLSQALSGFILPLRLLPDWFTQLCQVTPFPAIINAPAEIYLGLLTPQQVWNTLIVQGAWFAILSAAALLVLRAGVRRLVIQGG